MSDSAVFRPEKLTQIYSSRREYDSPGKLFKLDVPTAWTRYVDLATLENAVVEGFLSPDGRASIQVIEFAQGQIIDTDRKAFKSLELMSNLYGFEWRVSDDRALDNGLERLIWTAPRFDVVGESYFDTYRNYLYMFNIIWEEETGMIYRPMLDEIVASFRYE